MAIIPAVLADSFIESPGLMSGSAIPMGLGAVGLFFWSKKIQKSDIADNRKRLHQIAMGLAGLMFFANVGSMFLDLGSYTPLLGIGLLVVVAMIFIDKHGEKKEDKTAPETDAEEGENVLKDEARGEGGETHGEEKAAKEVLKVQEEEEEKKEEIEKEVAEGVVEEEALEEAENVEEVMKKTDELLKEESEEEKAVEDMAETGGGHGERVIKKAEKALWKRIFEEHKEEIQKIKEDIDFNEKEMKAIDEVKGMNIKDEKKEELEKRKEKLKKTNEELAKMQEKLEKEEAALKTLKKKKKKLSKKKMAEIEVIAKEKEKLVKQLRGFKSALTKELKSIGKDEVVDPGKLTRSIVSKKAIIHKLRKEIEKKNAEIRLVEEGKKKELKELEKAPAEDVGEVMAEAEGTEPPKEEEPAPAAEEAG